MPSGFLPLPGLRAPPAPRPALLARDNQSRIKANAFSRVSRPVSYSPRRLYSFFSALFFSISYFSEARRPETSSFSIFSPKIQPLFSEYRSQEKVCYFPIRSRIAGVFSCPDVAAPFLSCVCSTSFSADFPIGRFSAHNEASLIWVRKGADFFQCLLFTAIPLYYFHLPDFRSASGFRPMRSPPPATPSLPPPPSVVSFRAILLFTGFAIRLL